MRLSLTDAAAALATAAAALVEADVEATAPADRMNAYEVIETALRRVPTAQHAILASLDRDVDPHDLGAATLAKAIAHRCRLSHAEATRRLAIARDLAPRRGLDGQPLPPLLAHTATAQTAGTLSGEHLHVIRSFLHHLPDAVPADLTIAAERTLAELAGQVSPTALAKAADRLAAYLHPDGTYTDADRQRHRSLTLGPQRPDGHSRLTGWITAECRALLEPLLAKFAATDPTRVTPPDPTPQDGQGPGGTGDDGPGQGAAGAAATAEGGAADGGVADGGVADGGVADGGAADGAAAEDGTAEGGAADGGAAPQGAASAFPGPLLDDTGRTRAQRHHDALQTMARMLLCTKGLGDLNGLPVSVVVTTTLQELHAGAGYALTAGGTRLPMPDLIRLAAHAHHYLAVFDRHTQQALYLGRTHRCATGPQKLMLFARDRGCTCPGCAAAGYDCQAHHASTAWAAGGHTNVDDMTLACGPDNRMVETAGVTTRRRPDGLTEWIPPPHLDHGQPRINHDHHPERLLRPPDDDDPG